MADDVIDLAAVRARRAAAKVADDGPKFSARIDAIVSDVDLIHWPIQLGDDWEVEIEMTPRQAEALAVRLRHCAKEARTKAGKFPWE